MPKWVPWLVGLFLLFVIYNQPDMAAEFARGFGGFLGDMLRSFFRFLGSLFGGLDSGGAGGNVTSSGATLPATSLDVANGADHLQYHTHPIPTTVP